MEGMQPFGEMSFEKEKKVLGKYWNEYYFEHAPFNSLSIQSKTYLIIGRRGCGKSSLSEHYKYQGEIKTAQCVTILDNDVYNNEIHKIAVRLRESSELTISNLVSIWEFIIWQIIIKKYAKFDETIKKACIIDSSKSSTKLVRLLIDKLLENVVGDAGYELVTIIETELRKATFNSAKECILKKTKKQPVIVSFDSKDQYDIEDYVEMSLAASLVQCAAIFNMEYAKLGIHIKVFMTDEIFPHLKEQYITNTAKYVYEPIFLYWRPKDLVRLLCWRFNKYLTLKGINDVHEGDVNWDNFQEVHEKIWLKYFGSTIRNMNNIEERTLPYIIRHTQLRPRQVVMICNKIANHAMEEDTFPFFSQRAVLAAVNEMELELADELINSYSRIYPQIGSIVSALSGLPMVFEGRNLDTIAHRTASAWEKPYSPLRFRQIVTELGIIGRQRGNRDKKTCIVKGDFEFAMRDRLFIHEKDYCVIHPMLYHKLNTQYLDKTCIYPFPSHPDFEMILE